MSEGKVVIVGGGIGGLSAAHELATRGFEVEVYEHHPIPGGKARSIGVTGTGKDGRHDLPAEHGFRFFPAYYRHVIDTMSNIPFWGASADPGPDASGSGKPGPSVLDQLVCVDTISMTSFRHGPIISPAALPHTLRGWWSLWRHMRKQPKIAFGKGELRYYMTRLWQILTSCHERRDDEYEVIPWWDFIGAGERSLNYQRYLANLTRTLVAANPRKVSTRTNGNVWLQTLMGMWSSVGDRVLSGPTNEMWIYPWVKWLIEQHGVKYFVNAHVTELIADDGSVAGVRVRHRTPDEPKEYADPWKMVQIEDCDRYGITKYREVAEPEIIARGDYYVSAVPVERMSELLGANDETFRATSPLAEWDGQLALIPPLSASVQWMNGLLFYLKNAQGRGRPPNLPGHTIYADAPFALTSIFQPQYWQQDIELSRYGDGTVTNIFSVDISDWMEGRGRIYDKPARDLTREEVMQEVWEDLKGSLKHHPASRLSDDNLVTWYLDFDISPDTTLLERNSEPLLVNRVNTWRLRPEAATAIPNLLLASDYVRTNTDLATMEGANEAARRAVNAILEKSGSNAPRCKIWEMQEPDFLEPCRKYDLDRYRHGEPWGKFPWSVRLRVARKLLRAALGRKKA